MTTISIIKPDQRDRDFLADIAPFFMSSEVRSAMPYLKDSPTKTWLLSRCDGEVVGIAGILPCPRWTELCSLYVMPDFRGRGIGRLLIDARMDIVSGRVRTVCNTVSAGFYVGRGFIEVMRRGSYRHMERFV